MPNQWIPISEAPKNLPKPEGNIFTPRSDIILGWRGSPTVMTGYWHPGKDDSGEWDQLGERGAWASSTGLIVSTPPTHFMFLPDPPTK